MAAEFDAAGFSALDQFFGSVVGDADGAHHNHNNNDNKKAIGQEKDGTRWTKGNRRGVGSAVPLTTTTMQSDLTKKVLTVGRKRRRRGEDDDQDDDDNLVDVAADSMVDDEEHDDEGGRTAIGAPRNSTNSDTNTTTLIQETKKKRGKKERNKSQQQRMEDTSSSALGSASENQTTTETTDEDVVPKEEESRKKQKRRKIRSKQKNIRKDNREQEQKPNHLVVGRRNYNGRPLTAETRAKLHLPAPKARPAPTFVLEQSQDEDHGVVEVGRLAIDDLLEDDTGKIVETPTIIQGDRKTKQKSKRPKYKNLRV